MSKETYTFDDLEDILAEFSGKKESVSEPVIKDEVKPAPAAKPVAEQKKAEPRPEKTAPEKKAAAKPAEKKAAPAAKPQRKSAGSSFAEFEALFSGDSLKKQAAEKQAEKKSSSVKPEAALKPSPTEDKKAVAKQAKAELKAEKAAQKAARAEEKKMAKAEKKAAEPKAELSAAIPVVEEVPAKKPSLLLSMLSFVLALVCFCAMLGWVVFNVHPASGSVSNVENSTVLKLSDKLDVYMNNVASDALGELAYIKKIYTLQESDTVAPVPKPENFGRTTDVAVIQDVIKKAAPLLEGQTVAFDPNADFVPDTEFMYYLDDTIMVIAWKEYINQRCCTIAEVKIAHGSQIRRKLAEDSYSSSVQYYASDMATQSNAVIAINGDFYAFRDLGITVYQRKLYRNNPAQVDSCFFTADGDMIFSRAGELMGEGETQQFIDENNVVFAIAFGPVLVDNGELQYCESYPIGEINTEYSRSCIGMTDELHYLLMTINHTPDARPRATINELARYIYSKGVQKAYTLDGGQTAEIVMFGAPINHVDFGFERTVSDIIYFATAIPDEEVS